MANPTREAASTAEILAKRVPVLFFLVREGGGYKARRRWGIFDSLGVRAIDDLTFPNGEGDKIVFAFTQEPHHASDAKVISIPSQIAFERIFFHVQGVSSVVLDPAVAVSGCALQQTGIEFSSASSKVEERRLIRAELPEIIGAYALPRKKVADPLARSEKAFRKSSLFESLYLARRARLKSDGGSLRAWFFELMSLSFMGLPDEALSLYEEYLQHASGEPHAQLIGARYRLLLKQLNEARTILHTLTFHDELGAMASCELARSFILSGEFDRAIDLASSALKRDASLCEAYLVRGIAQRGLSYAVGDEDGLKDALKDLEKVAGIGGFNSPEALFHAGTIFGRLGALEQAEVALRQSLFQRDRYSSRDALIRVLCAAHKGATAREELDLLCELMPIGTEDLRREIETHISAVGDEAQSENRWPTELKDSLNRASTSLSEWKIPVRGDLRDFAILDDFINRFAPAGEFMATGEFSHLRTLDVSLVVRAISLYLADLLVQRGQAEWDDAEPGSLSIRSARGLRIPIEAFVRERIVLGASSDNLSCLDSLVAETGSAGGFANSSADSMTDWWRDASSEEVKDFAEQCEWTRSKLTELGSELAGTLSDFDELDRVIESVFEPGGALQEAAQVVIGDAADRFVVGLGLLVGSIIANMMPARWCTHELPEGVSLVAQDLGRIFPVARLQRRVYLSSAADTSGKLASFAFGIAAAIVSQRVRSGVYQDRPHVVTALRELLPRLSEFADSEIEGVADTIFQSAQIR
jgi:tetratricopeptide (TPR) repeat protein